MIARYKKNYVGHFFSCRNHTRSYVDQNEPSQTKSSLRESIILTTSGRNWFMQPRTILLFRNIWRYLQLKKSKNIEGIKRYDAPKITDMRWFKIVLHLLESDIYQFGLFFRRLSIRFPSSKNHWTFSEKSRSLFCT